MSKTLELARHLETLHINDMYKTDFYWTWDKTDDEIDAIFTVADALRDLRERNKSTRIFDSGLGISLFRDNSTRTRFSFASACNLLGLEEQVLDEKKSQIAHGETVRETANMVSFMADVIGIRDDMYIGEGHKYQKTFMDALEEGYRDGILEQRPTLVNLQCDVDHPTQCMADMLHVIHYFGGVENLKGKKVAMTWAYSPSYGKPLSVPQGVIGLFTRFGMDVTLAHPEGYDVMPEVEAIARQNCEKYGSRFHKTNDMKEAFRDADIVYPKSWAPFAAMEERTRSERMKVELVTNVSHDLKTPLTSIISYAELLEQEHLEPPAGEYVTILSQKAQRLKGMVQDVFEVSKAASGQLPVSLKRLDLARLLRQTLADMDQPIQESGLQLRTQLPDHSVLIQGDSDRLYRVFQNLLGNALKYSLAGSRVYLTLTVEEGQAVAALRNTSAAELRPGLDYTQRFVRGDESRTTEGSGLGLSIARWIVDRHGGWFEVVSREDVGTRITFVLPLEGTA